MLNIFPKTLLAATLSVAVALTGMTMTATPARADNDDAAAIIAGIIALYAIGRAIDNRNDNRAVTRGNAHRPRAAAPVHRNPRVAPARCFVQGRTVRGDNYRGYGARCMQNNVARPALLPQQCLVRLRTPQGRRNVYGGRCLAQNGWSRG